MTELGLHQKAVNHFVFILFNPTSTIKHDKAKASLTSLMSALNAQLFTEKTVEPDGGRNWADSEPEKVRRFIFHSKPIMLRFYNVYVCFLIRHFSCGLYLLQTNFVTKTNLIQTIEIFWFTVVRLPRNA